MAKFQARKIVGEVIFRKKMGLDFNARMSFFMGISHPQPDWYDDLTEFQKKLWGFYKRFGELMIFLVLLSNIGLLIISYDDIRVFCTCTGTAIYVFCVTTKIVVFRKHLDKFHTVMNEIYTVSSNLNKNPVDDKDFLDLHHRYYKMVKIFGIGKTSAFVGAVSSLLAFKITYALMHNESKDLVLPMDGWFPYKPHENPYYIFYCLFQFVAYSLFLLKDIALDLMFLAILVILNTHLIYLRKLLGIIISQENCPEKYKRVKWWIKQHHLVLRYF